MFEVLLLSCLAGEVDCRTDRIPGGPTLQDCRYTAMALAADITPPRWAQEYPCVPEGAPRPDMAISQIGFGVYVHKGHHGSDPDHENGGDLANLAFVIGDKSVAVIDTGTHPHVGAALLEAIRAETALPVEYVILTHVHPDHTLGVRPFVEAGARVIAHANYNEAMAARRDTYLMNMERAGLSGLTPEDVVLNAEGVADTMEIDLGGRKLTLTAHATAHTNSDLTVYDHDSSTLFMGDLLFLDHTPAVDGSLTGWLKVMEGLVKAEAYKAVPGHGPVAVWWPQGAVPMVHYLEVVAADTRKAIKDGLTMQEATAWIGERARAGWLFFDQFNPRNATAAFQELEWE